MSNLNTHQQTEALYSAIEDLYDPRAKPLQDIAEAPWVLDWVVDNLHSAGYAIVKEEK